MAVRKHCSTADPDYKVEFREPITSIIPSLMIMLGNEEKSIRVRAVELIGRLANHGEQQSYVIAV